MKGVCRGGGHGSIGTSPVFLFSPLSCVSLYQIPHHGSGSGRNVGVGGDTGLIIVGYIPEKC